MRWLLDALYLSALTLLSPWLVYRAIRTGRYRRGLSAKLFGLSQSPFPSGRPVWFHGVSVGEIHLLRQVIAAFRRRRPDLAVRRLHDDRRRLRRGPPLLPRPGRLLFPFDFSWAVGRTLRRVDPALIVLAEGELWPNFLLAARRQRRPGRRGQRPHESAQRRPLPPAALADRPAVRLHRPLRRPDGGIRRGRAFAGRAAGSRPRHRIGEVRWRRPATGTTRAPRSCAGC